MSYITIQTDTKQISVASDEQLNQLFESGEVLAGHFAFIHSQNQWMRVSELPQLQDSFSKPNIKLEKPMIYFFEKMANKPFQQTGPFTLSQANLKIQIGEVSANNWVFVDGDKEWRSVKDIAVLKKALPNMPEQPPTVEAAPPTNSIDPSDLLNTLEDNDLSEPTSPSINIEMANLSADTSTVSKPDSKPITPPKMNPPVPPTPDTSLTPKPPQAPKTEFIAAPEQNEPEEFEEREEVTMAISSLGLSSVDAAESTPAEEIKGETSDTSTSTESGLTLQSNADFSSDMMAGLESPPIEAEGIDIGLTLETEEDAAPPPPPPSKKSNS